MASYTFPEHRICASASDGEDIVAKGYNKHRKIKNWTSVCCAQPCGLSSALSQACRNHEAQETIFGRIFEILYCRSRCEERPPEQAALMWSTTCSLPFPQPQSPVGVEQNSHMSSVMQSITWGSNSLGLTRREVLWAGRRCSSAQQQMIFQGEGL